MPLQQQSAWPCFANLVVDLSFLSGKFAAELGLWVASPWLGVGQHLQGTPAVLGASLGDKDGGPGRPSRPVTRALLPRGAPCRQPLGTPTGLPAALTGRKRALHPHACGWEALLRVLRPFGNIFLHLSNKLSSSP